MVAFEAPAAGEAARWFQAAQLAKAEFYTRLPEFMRPSLPCDSRHRAAHILEFVGMHCHLANQKLTSGTGLGCSTRFSS